MASGSVKPLPGQGVFGDMPSAEVQQFEGFKGQSPIAGFLTPEYWRLNPEDYADITPQMVEIAAPTRLRESIIDVPPRSPGAVSFMSADEHRPVWVALNPIEYGHIIRNIEAMGAAAVNHTLATRSGTHSLEAHESAAERSAIHQIERKQTKMQDYLELTLQPETERLARFIEYTTHHWLRRKKGIDMHAELTWIQEELFGNLLTVVGRQRSWDEEQAALAQKSVQWRLFFDRGHNRHITNWRDMLTLAQQYQQAKTALYKDRIYRSKRYIQQHEQ